MSLSPFEVSFLERGRLRIPTMILGYSIFKFVFIIIRRDFIISNL